MNLRDTLSDHVTSFLSSLHPGIATGSSNLANAGNRPSVATSSGANHCEILTDLEWTTSWSRDDEETASDKSRVHDRDGSVLRQSVNGSDRHLYGADSQAYDRADIRSTYYDVFDWVSGSAATRRGGHVTDGRDDADSRLVPEAARADSDTASIEHPERRTSAISSVARSKRTLGAMIAVSSTSGHPVYGLPVSSGQSSSRIHRDSLDDRSTNRTASLTDYVSETIHNAFGANDSHGAEHVQSGSFERPNQDGVASVLPSSASRLANGDDWRAGGRTALDQSSSPFEFGQSRAPSVLTSRPDDVTGLAETGTSVSSTPFPGYVNVNNISFDGLLDHYLGNFTSPCIDWTTNGTCLYGNGTAMNATVTWSDGGDVIAPPIRLWTLFLLIFPLFTVFGNILVVMSVYKEKSLRTVTNYFIVSLAIADIMVAVLVMPLAVYVELVNQHWTLGDALCDTWVAFDVMCCTASILNLTAISVDRFIAVTQPLKYARHKNSNRVWVMLVMTWVVSVAISSPIALGMNYTERRDPNMCVFYNADFLIYSSMGSFYIPCLIMILLYWRIFRAIRMRAKKGVKKPKPTPNSLNVIENRAQTGRTTSDASATEDSCHKELLPVSGNSAAHARSLMRSPIAEETSFTNYNVRLNTTTENSGDDSSHSQSQNDAAQIQFPVSDDEAHVIPNDKSTDPALSATSDDNGAALATNHRCRDPDTGYVPPTRVVVETHAPGVVGSSTSTLTTHKTLLSPPPRRPIMNPGVGVKVYTPGRRSRRNGAESPKKSVTKFNFHLHRAHSKKKKDVRSCSSRRERKATKTLAIVLGVFLLCWVPFFTVNIMNAICIRFELFDRPECNIDGMLFSFFVWLGYINSFLNPVIYTIFNVEFRRSFKKLLFQPCK